MRYPAASTARLAGLAFLAMTASNTASAQPAPRRALERPPVQTAPALDQGSQQDLKGLLINNGTFPEYRTGINLDIRHEAIRESGPRVRVQLYLPLDNLRVLIAPQAQLDGRLIAHLPADLYARSGKAELTVIVGDTTLRNTTGRFVAEIVPVPADKILPFTTVRCTVMCVSWPASKDLPAKWVSTTKIHDKFEHTAPTGEEVGGKWSVGQTTYHLTSRRLKDQFRFTRVRMFSPTMSGGCPANIRENVWVYPGQPLPQADDYSGLHELDVYARANVVHCRARGKNNFDATHFVFADMVVEVDVEGPKGVDPWE